MYSNRYIFLYASAMVIIVAIVLSTAATLLSPFQERNIRIEKIQNILASINIESTKSNAEELFGEYIIDAKILDYQGVEIEGDAFEIDMAEENRKKPEDRNLPLYIAKIENDTIYIIPLYGSGLWGPIWGYISLEADLTTILGANFDHSAETPGLGAEISESQFESQFKGKKIYDDAGAFRSVSAIRGGARDDDPHGVDAITGGTITSNGLNDMISNGLKLYEPFFKKLKAI